MARKTVLLDDLDGTELPDGSEPIRLSLGRTTYNLYLSEKNHGKLMDALTPFIENAEKESASPRATKSSGGTDKEKMRAVREWAKANNVKQANGKPLGDRGRIPAEIIAAYDEAN